MYGFWEIGFRTTLTGRPGPALLGAVVERVPQTEACLRGLCWLEEMPARAPDPAPAFHAQSHQQPVPLHPWPLLQDTVPSRLPEQRTRGSTPVTPQHLTVSGTTWNGVDARGVGTSVPRKETRKGAGRIPVTW